MFASPITPRKTSSRVSGMSIMERFLASRWVTSMMMWVNAVRLKASFSRSCPSLAGVPTATPTLVRSRYAICSWSLKCLAKSFATSPPFSPLYSLNTRVTSATRNAAPATKMSVGAPFVRGFWDRRSFSWGRPGPNVNLEQKEGIIRGTF